MSRRRKADKRDIIPDPKFNDRVLSRFINIVMNDGKKSIAEKIVYQALEIASNKLKEKNSLDLFKTALNNVKPGIEVRSRRVGGATYQVPVEVRNERALALAIRYFCLPATSAKPPLALRRMFSLACKAAVGFTYKMIFACPRLLQSHRRLY